MRTGRPGPPRLVARSQVIYGAKPLLGRASLARLTVAALVPIMVSVSEASSVPAMDHVGDRYVSGHSPPGWLRG